MQIQLNPDDLRTIVEAAVLATVERLAAAGIFSQSAGQTERIAFTEAEAAGSLGIPRTALRDARLRGLVRPAKLGKRHLYDRPTLVRLAAGLPPETAATETPSPAAPARKGRRS